MMYCLKSCFAVLFLTAVFLSREGVQSLSLSRWIKMNKHLVCFEGKGSRFGSFHNHAKAGLVVALKLQHVNGYIRCGGGSTHNSYWGCRQWTGLMEHPFNVVVTDQYNHILFPKKGNHRNIHDAQGPWYWVPFANSATSKEIIFTEFANPFYFPKNKQMRIWFGEDLKNAWEADNYGHVCVNVYAKFLY